MDKLNAADDAPCCENAGEFRGEKESAGANSTGRSFLPLLNAVAVRVGAH